MNTRINYLSPSYRSLAIIGLLAMIISGSSTLVSAFSARAVPMSSVQHQPVDNALNHYFFETTTALPRHPLHSNFITSTSSTSHASRKKKSTTCLRMNFSPPDNKDIGGLNEGKYLLLFVVSACIWIFSIPPEFRRARFCTDEDVRLYPEKHCTTFDAWRKGISEYYARGGGVHFDFSIEGK